MSEAEGKGPLNPERGIPAEDLLAAEVDRVEGPFDQRARLPCARGDEAIAHVDARGPLQRLHPVLIGGLSLAVGSPRAHIIDLSARLRASGYKRGA
jgi:hypothetical protein